MIRSLFLELKSLIICAREDSSFLIRCACRYRSAGCASDGEGVRYLVDYDIFPRKLLEM